MCEVHRDDDESGVVIDCLFEFQVRVVLVVGQSGMFVVSRRLVIFVARKLLCHL